MQRNFNTEPQTRIFKREVKLKDSFLKPVSINNLREELFLDWEESVEASRRSKSIHKKPLWSRRNIQQMMSTRQKNTYSANTYILSQNYNFRNLTLESYQSPEEWRTDLKPK